MKNIIIKEEVQIPGTDIILEKGDKVKILESYMEIPEMESLARQYGYGDIIRSLISNMESFGNMRAVIAKLREAAKILNTLEAYTGN